MKHSDQLDQLAAALAVAQGQMKPAKMNAVNPFLKNKYADLGAVMDACRDVLANNGLSFVQMAFTPPLETYGPAVGVETMLMHKSGQWLCESFVLPVGDEKGKSIMQVAGSAISYARRYALAAMLGIVADEDADGNDQPKTTRQQPTINRSPAPLPPVTVVIPPGVNPETGELNTKPPQEMTWEELNNAPRFVPNTEVMARGKRDELPGVVVRDDGGATVTVRVNGKEYQFGRDKLTPIPQQPALIDAEPPTGYQE